MSYHLRGPALAALAAIAVTTGGCSTPPSSTGSSGGGGDLGAAVVTVNGEPIIQSEFYQALQSHRARQNEPSDALGKTVMTGLINAKLTEELAKKDGVAPTQQQIDTAYNNRKLLSEAQSTVPFNTALSDSLLTSDRYKELEVAPIVAQLNLYAKGVTVSDADAKAFYDSHKDQFLSPQRAHIKRIIVGSQTEAASIYSQIKAGRQFEEFLSSSLDHSTTTGDVFQWIPLTGPATAQIKPIVDAINTTGEGEVTTPIKIGNKTTASYWLIKVVEKKPAETKTFDQVKDVIHESLVSEKANSNIMTSMTIGKEMSDFSRNAKIVAVDPRYQSVVDALRTAGQAAAAPSPPMTQQAPPAAAAPPAKIRP